MAGGTGSGRGESRTQLRTVRTYLPGERPDVLVGGRRHLVSRRTASVVPGPAGDWWGQCQYTIAPGQQMLGWIHQDQLRRDADLADDDGLLGPIPMGDHNGPEIS